MEGIKVYSVYQIVRKMVGEINPVGETNEDKARYENLIDMTVLVINLISDIKMVADNNKGRNEYSMKKAGKFSDDFIKGLADLKSKQEI